MRLSVGKGKGGREKGEGKGGREGEGAPAVGDACCGGYEGSMGGGGGVTVDDAECGGFEGEGGGGFPHQRNVSNEGSEVSTIQRLRGFWSNTNYCAGAECSKVLKYSRLLQMPLKLHRM
jgi:hypothetical protein